MAEYEKTEWTDEVPASTPVKYSITDDVEGAIATSAEIAVVTSVTAGTSLSAANLNKIEIELYSLRNDVEEIVDRILNVLSMEFVADDGGSYQSVPVATDTYITWDNIITDNGYIDPVDNSKIIIPATGRYRIRVRSRIYSITSSPVPTLSLGLYNNALTLLSGFEGATVLERKIDSGYFYKDLTANDVLRLKAYVTGGAARVADADIEIQRIS